jgi:small subunit ribosomal protein S4e
MKQHLKQLPAPATWKSSKKKEGRFVLRPNPGAGSRKFGLALGSIIRDEVRYASTLSEAKKVLNNQQVLVDGIRRKDPHFLVSLFAVVTFVDLAQSYRLLLDQKGRIKVQEIPSAERTAKLCKITGKAAVRGGKIQYHFHDGKNIIMDEEAHVGDTVLLSLPDLKIQEVFQLKPGASILFVSGKHSGDIGELKEIKGKEVIYISNGQNVETTKAYAFVVGKKKPALTI